MNFKTIAILLFCFGLTTISIAQCPTTNIVLDTQGAIDSFSINYPGCSITPSTVGITIEESVPGSISNLDGLAQLTSIGGDLDIKSNFLLTNVAGLGQLSSIGGFFQIINNTSLPNIDGLGKLSSIDKFFRLMENPSLSNLDGFTQLITIGEDIWIRNNSFLSNVDGFNQLTSIGGYLYIRNNPALTNLNGFNHLTTTGAFIEVSNNAALSNLNGLGQVTSIGGYLEISSNLQLDNCCALCPLFAAYMVDPSIIIGGITVQNNLAGCMSEAEINACNPCGLVGVSKQEESLKQLSVSPNPVEDILRFQLDSQEDELIDFALENPLGKQLLRGQAATNQLEAVDVSGLAAGLYLLRVWYDGKVESQLIIKE